MTLSKLISLSNVYEKMTPTSSFTSQHPSAKYYSPIASWFVSLTSHFSYPFCTTEIALSMLDRFIFQESCFDKKTFQLVALTSLHVAFKLQVGCVASCCVASCCVAWRCAG